MSINLHKGVDILGLEAKDIYLANKYGSKNIGVNPKYTRGEQTGEYIFSKFTNKLDFSLCLIQLHDVYKKVYRNNKFIFKENNHLYTNRVITVTFNYSVKEWNKVNSDTYVKIGYDYNELEFDDCICVINNELVGVKVKNDIDNPVNSEMLGDCFALKDNQYHVNSGKIKTILSTSDLRRMLYKDGFKCDGINFTRFMRSSGSSRVGKCLFIDENLYPRIMKWIMNKIVIDKDEQIDLASLEAYISLTLSSIIDTLPIKPENILVVDDYESEFYDDIIETKLIDGKLKTSPSHSLIKNSIWDGQSLMDKSLFGKYNDKGMLLLRNRFFKSCCFNCNIQKWFMDNDIISIDQLNGFTLAKSIEDVKLITTPSSIKYLKFGKLITWLKNLETEFGVVKYEKKPFFLEGKLVQSHYQLLNTLQLTSEEVASLVKPSLDYLNLIKTDPCVLRYHIKYPDSNSFGDISVASKNDIVYKLMGINSNFTKTKMYTEFKQDVTKSYVKNLRKGHLFIEGNYSTMVGNPIEMLLHSINKFNGSSQIGIGNIVSHRFDYNNTLLGSRSPHVCQGNIWLPYNTQNSYIDKYLNMTTEIVAVNSINENTLMRLSGADFDSDSVLLTNNEILIRAALKNYRLFKVPTCNVDATKTKRYYNHEQLTDLDIKTSGNRIGEIINLSQELNTLLWDTYHYSCDFANISSLYNDICQLDVMSMLEIDKAKKEFEINMANEIKRIKNKWKSKDGDSKNIKPYFFSHIARYKGYYNPIKNNYIQHNTSMDYLEKEINKEQRKRVGNKTKTYIKFHQIINSDLYNSQLVNRKQFKIVLNLITDLKYKSRLVFSRTYNSPTAKNMGHKMYYMYKNDCVKCIGKMSINKDTMIFMLKKFDSKEYQYIYKTIFKILFGYPNTSFYSVIEKSKENLDVLEFDQNGNIEIFNYKFKKIQKS